MIKRDKFRKGKLGEVKSDNIIFSHYRPFLKPIIIRVYT